MSELLKILLLEDSASDAAIASRLLLKAWPGVGVEIMIAQDKDSFNQQLENFHPSIVLSDHSLPQFNSVDALHLARQKYPGIPFIMLTGAVSEEFAATIIKSGANDYVLKDRMQRLPAAIEAALKQRRIEKEKAEAAERMVQSEEKYRTLIEQAFDGIIIYSPDGTIQDCNHTACTSMGYLADELKGVNITKLFFEQDLKKRPLYYESLKAGYPTLDYRRLKRKDGSFVEMEIGTKMLSNGNLMAIGRDITERRAAEQKIIQSESNLRAIFESTSEGILLMDIHGIVKTFNKKSEEYSFLTRSRRIQVGDNLFDFIPEDRKAFFQETINQVLAGKSVHYDRAFDMGNQEIQWAAFSITPVLVSGSIIGVCVSGRNISATKRADEALKKNLADKQMMAERMRTILNTLPADIALLDEKGDIIEINDSWKLKENMHSIMGAGSQIGSNYLSAVTHYRYTDKATTKLAADGIARVLAKQAAGYSLEYPCNFKKETVWYRMIVSPLMEQEISGAVVMHMNITERKSGEQALEATLKELSDYKIALDESSIVSITNQKGIITYVNTNFCGISQYNPEDLLGKEHRVVNSGYHPKEFIATLWATIGEGKIWRNEVRNRAKDGSIYWVDATIVPFLNENGRPIQYVAINKDITAKKMMEQEIQEQKLQEHKKIIRAIIKAQEKERNHIGQELHDNINQILAGSKLYLSMSAHKDEMLKDLIKYPVELIDTAISEIRILSSRHVTPPKNINLKDLIQSLLEKLQMNTHLKTSFSYDGLQNNIDDDLKLNVYRIIQEKINNVVKHAEAKNVNVKIQVDEKNVQVDLTDDGKGFDIKDKKNGIGISNMINRVESFNGEMLIDSKPGKGCKVKITIPIQA